MTEVPPDRPAAYYDALDDALQARVDGVFDPDALRRRHPEHADAVIAELAVLSPLDRPAVIATPMPMPSREALSALPSRLGDFELGEEIGRGGMGVVYAARQLSLDRDVAVKILPPGFATDPQLRRRFEREAALAARLVHPGIVRIYAFGEEDGVLYLAMERIDGPSLHAVSAKLDEPTAEAFNKAAGANPPTIGGFRGFLDAVVDIGVVVSDALENAHRAGLVHRDVKPGNILLDADGAPHLADFGLARAVDSRSLTASGHTLGTPAFLAPECIQGEVATDRSDVFALGVTLYEALARRSAFGGETTAEVLNRVLTFDPPPLDRIDKRIPADLANVVHRALEKEPHRRYASAAALRDDLTCFRRGEPVSAVRIGVVGRAVRRARRRPRTTALAGGLILLLIALSTIWFVSSIRSANARKLRYTDLVKRGQRLEAADQLTAAMEVYREATGLETGDGAGAAAIARLRPILERKQRRRLHQVLLGEILTADAPITPVTEAKLERWVQESGNDRDGAVMRAFVALQRGQSEVALQHVDRALALQPSQGMHYLRSYALTRLGRQDEAAAARRRGEALAPERLEDYAIAASRRYREGDAEAAIDLLRRGQARLPASPLLNHVQGWFCFRSWRYEEALTQFDQALLQEPGLTAVRVARGRCLLELRRHREACKEFERVVAERPDFERAVIGLAEGLFFAPGDDQAANRKRATAMIETAIERRPGADLYNIRGWFRASSGDYPGAEADYRRALTLEPNNFATINLAIFLRLARRLDEHQKHIDDCLARPDYPTRFKIAMLNERALRYWSSDPNRAEAALRRALDLRRTPNIVGNLALLNLNRGRYDDAIPQLTEQIGKGYAAAAALCRRGYCRFRTLDGRRALTDHDLGLARVAENAASRVMPWMRFNRAVASASVGQFAAAAREIDRDDLRLNSGYSLNYLRWRFRAEGLRGLRDAVARLAARGFAYGEIYQKIVAAWQAAGAGRFEEARESLPDPGKSGRRWPDPAIWIAIEWGARENSPALRAVAARLLDNRPVAEALATLSTVETPRVEAERAWLLGRERVAAGDAKGALPDLKRAFDALPYSTCAVDLGIAYHALGRDADAIAAFDEAMKRDFPSPFLCERLIRAGVEPRAALRTWLNRLF